MKLQTVNVYYFLYEKINIKEMEVIFRINESTNKTVFICESEMQQKENLLINSMVKASLN